MKYEIYIFMICTLFSAFALSGVNFENIMKKNRIWEARILAMFLTLALGYLVSSFFLALL